MTKASWTPRAKTKRDMLSYMFWTSIAGAVVGTIFWGGAVLTTHHPTHGDFAIHVLIWLASFVTSIIIFMIFGAVVGYRDWKHDSPAVWSRECLESPEEAAAALQKVLDENGISYRKDLLASELSTYDPHHCDWAAAIGDNGLILKAAHSPDSMTCKVYLGPQRPGSERLVEGVKELVDKALGVN